MTKLVTRFRAHVRKYKRGMWAYDIYYLPSNGKWVAGGYPFHSQPEALRMALYMLRQLERST